jgi:hypothetical protein
LRVLDAAKNKLEPGWMFPYRTGVVVGLDADDDFAGRARLIESHSQKASALSPNGRLVDSL